MQLELKVRDEIEEGVGNEAGESGRRIHEVKLLGILKSIFIKRPPESFRDPSSTLRHP